MSGVLTLGETLGLVEVGSLRHAASARIGIGGAESNVAVGVRRLGVPAAWVGRVGADSWGDRVLRELRAEDVEVHAVRDPEAPTALMTKERRTAQHTTVLYHRTGSAGSRLRPQDVPAEAVAGASVVHVTGITAGLSPTALASVHRAVELAGAAGVPVSFDVNHRDGVWGPRPAAAVYRELAEHAAVVFAGVDEARLLTGSDAADPHELLDALAATTRGDVVLKRGPEGCLALLDGTRYDVPAVDVAVVDTVGAGDAFVAGYLVELVSGRGPEDRLATAVRCGAYACLTLGDWEGLPTRADLHLLDPDRAADPVRR